MNKVKSEFDFSAILASSVHDMKNSVGVLLASVEAILEEFQPKGERQTKHFNTLHYESSRINGELIQLLTLYRKDKGFLPLHVDEHIVLDVIEEQLARNQLLIDSSDISVEIDCDENLLWYFDSDLIGGVVHNVIVNCIRYTRDKLRIVAAEQDGRLSISIEDNGKGYPADMLTAPSKRIEEAKLASGATHLGLYFAEQIAALHSEQDKKGEIKLKNESSLGGGEFRLVLP